MAIVPHPQWPGLSLAVGCSPANLRNPGSKPARDDVGWIFHPVDLNTMVPGCPNWPVQYRNTERKPRLTPQEVRNMTKTSMSVPHSGNINAKETQRLKQITFPLSEWK